VTSTALQVGSLQVKMTIGAAHTVAYDRLTPSHPPPQLDKQHAVPVAAQREVILQRLALSLTETSMRLTHLQDNSDYIFKVIFVVWQMSLNGFIA
jgi:hypothetical protein